MKRLLALLALVASAAFAQDGSISSRPTNTSPISTDWLLVQKVGENFTRKQAFSSLFGTGVSGGRTWTCGTAAGDDCTIVTTSNGTKGNLFIGTSTYDEANNRLGIGLTSPLVAFQVSANSTASASPPTGTMALFTQSDGNPARIMFDTFGGSSAAIDMRNAAGTSASRSAIQNQSAMGQFSGFAYGSTGYSSTPRARFQFIADQTWTDANQGTALLVATTPNNSTTIVNRFKIDNAGHITTLGTAPSMACTGTGTSPASPTAVGTDSAFIITMSTGTGSPGSTGTCTPTFAIGFDTNAPVMSCTAVKGATAWGAGVVLQITTESTTAPVITWTNYVAGVATALTTSTSYKIACVVIGRL